jgi:hypothetical protein
LQVVLAVVLVFLEVAVRVVLGHLLAHLEEAHLPKQRYL